MLKKNSKKKIFLSNVISIRDELTQKAQQKSELEVISMDDAKLIKEIASVIKELDRLICDHEIRETEQLNTSDFYALLRDKTLISDELKDLDYD